MARRKYKRQGEPLVGSRFPANRPLTHESVSLEDRMPDMAPLRRGAVFDALPGVPSSWFDPIEVGQVARARPRPRRGAGLLTVSPAKQARRAFDTSGRYSALRLLQLRVPKKVLFCIKRKARRSVLFAWRKVGFRGSSPGPYRRTQNSMWRC